MSRTAGLEPAYILHAREYRDTSLILDLLARDTGRYSVVTRGARSSKSKLRGKLQPFTPLLVASVGRGELKTSTVIEFPGTPFRISGRGLMFGLYVNELLYRLLGRFDPVTELYHDYEQLLSDLQGYEGYLVAIRRFELSLLQELGYGLNFEYDARDGQAVNEAGSYRFVANEGFHLTDESSQEVFPGAELLHLASGDYEEVDEKRLRNLTRQSLAPLIGDKPLKSRALFRGPGS